jgi:hypothetical protein
MSHVLRLPIRIVEAANPPTTQSCSMWGTNLRDTLTAVRRAREATQLNADLTAPQSVMEGRGAYNLNSALQASGAALALPVFEQAAHSIPLEDGDRPIVVADYGASEGRNSLIPISLAIRVLRQRAGRSRPICVVHTDLPANDFKSLFATVEETPESYARDGPVFPSAIGRSFFRALFPNCYVDLAWSSYAAQWLSRSPRPVPDDIVGFRGAGPLRQAFFDQGRADWETFLARRADELRPGGRLVVCLPSLNEAGLHPGALLIDAANEAIAEMLAEGSITAEERERMCIAVYPRTRAETLAPFAEGGSGLGLQLISSSFSPVEDVGWIKYREDRDAEALAAKRAGSFRATFGPSLASALRGDDSARQAFSDRLEAAMRRRLAIHPVEIANIVAILSLVRSKDPQSRANMSPFSKQSH